MSVWRKLNRVGKKAAQFQFTVSFEELTIQTCSAGKLDCVRVLISISRKARRYCSKVFELQHKGNNVLAHRWIFPENIEFETTLYRGTRQEKFDEKGWTFQVEEVLDEDHKKHRILTTIQLDFAEYAEGLPVQENLRIVMRTVSKMFVSGVLNVTVSSLMLKQGDATDEDLISIGSMMPFSRVGSVNAGSFANARASFRQAQHHKRAGSVGVIEDFSSITAKLEALNHNVDMDNDDERKQTELGKNSTSYNNNNNNDKDVGSLETSSTAQSLLKWCRQALLELPPGEFNVPPVNNLTYSFQNGVVLCALLYTLHPDKIDLKHVLREPDSGMKNIKLALDVAYKQLNIPPLLDANALAQGQFDTLTMITYLHQLRLYASTVKDEPLPTAKLPPPMPAKITKMPSVNSTSVDDRAPVTPTLRQQGTEKIPDYPDPRPLAKQSKDLTNVDLTDHYDWALLKARSLLGSSNDPVCLTKSSLYTSNKSPVPPPTSLPVDKIPGTIKSNPGNNVRPANRQTDLELQTAPAKQAQQYSLVERANVQLKRMKIHDFNLFSAGKGAGLILPASKPTHSQSMNDIRNGLHGGDCAQGGGMLHSSTSQQAVITLDSGKIDWNRVQQELVQIAEEQASLDSEAEQLEEELRNSFRLQHDQAKQDFLLMKWFQLVNRKNALIRRTHQLAMLERENYLKKQADLIRKEYQEFISKTCSDEEQFTQKESALMQRLCNVINERDEIVAELDKQEKAIDDDVKIQENMATMQMKSASLNRHYYERSINGDNSNCSLM